MFTPPSIALEPFPMTVTAEPVAVVTLVTAPVIWLDVMFTPPTVAVLLFPTTLSGLPVNVVPRSRY